jgi:DNA-binding beta-propeller fold protein YncE
MNKSPYIFLFICTLLSFLWSCKGDQPANKDIIASQYPDEIAQIILTDCAIPTCHDGSSQENGLDLSSWEQLFAGTDFGPVVVPYSAGWSPLFQHINTYEALGFRASPTMPLEAEEVLSSLEVSQIKDWIDNGAPNRSGETYWAQTTNQSGGKLFALCAGSDLVAVADLNSNLITRYISVGQVPSGIEAPHYITLSPDGQYFYVTMLEGGTIERYRTDNYAFSGRVEIGASPSLITVSPDGKRVIVSHWNDLNNSPKLTMIDAESMTIVQAIVAGGDFISFPHGLTTNADFSRLYVCANKGNYIMQLDIDENGFDNPEPFPIDPVFSPVPFASDEYQPYQIILSPDESRLFISCNKTDEVRVLDAQTKQLLSVIPVGKYPRLMDFDPDSKQLFVVCRDEPHPTKADFLGCISVIDTENMTEVKKVFDVGHSPHGVSVDRSRNRVFVSSENPGGIDPLRYSVAGLSGPRGKYHIIDMNTLTVILEEERELAIFPNALIVND